LENNYLLPVRCRFREIQQNFTGEEFIDYFRRKFIEMDHAVITVPAAPVRRKASHRKEMVNQLLFGESVKLLKSEGDLWVKVRSLHDGYEGWMTRTMLQPAEKQSVTGHHPFMTSDILGVISMGDTPMHIPAGSTLPFYADGKGKAGETDYSFTGTVMNKDAQQPSGDLAKQLAIPWLNSPYLWGGRTPMGVDCSGFTQVIFKLMGIGLPRDAWQQAQEGKPVKKFADSLPGDLAFFDNKEDIVHVGILLGDGEIIHASGRVRIDPIDKKGITSNQTGSPNTRLRAIRRYW
jgi:cell wall-associated NlpC family hydrolase